MTSISINRVDPTKSLVYVIGDPQGQISLLQKMFEKINNNPSHLPLAANDKIVILGNYLSETEDVHETLKSLKELHEKFKNQLVILRGAKEHLLLKGRAKFFKTPFGKHLISSYRIGVGNKPSYENSLVEKKFKHGLNGEVLLKDVRWLKGNTKPFYDAKNFFICSAGVNPAKKLNDQNVNSLLFNTEKFLKSRKKFEKMVIHGTVPSTKIDVKANRINVNSDPAKTGVLSCVILNDTTGKIEDYLVVKTSQSA